MLPHEIPTEDRRASYTLFVQEATPISERMIRYRIPRRPLTLAHPRVAGSGLLDTHIAAAPLPPIFATNEGSSSAESGVVFSLFCEVRLIPARSLTATSCRRTHSAGKSPTTSIVADLLLVILS